MKKKNFIFKKLFVFFTVVILLSACATNPLTGKRTMAFVSDSQLFPAAFAQYEEFLSENTVVTDTDEAEMVLRVGNKLAEASHKWLSSEGHPDYFDDYAWEFKLILDDTVNAWCMPGGKIVFYTGILPLTLNEDGLAVVMGHEIAHAVLNHSQQRMSAGILQQLGAVGLSIGLSGLSPEVQNAAMMAYGLGSQLGGMLPYSRAHENEADYYGLIITAIAGYDPEEAVPFWERMAAYGGVGVPEFLSTHPSNAARIRNLRNSLPEVKQKAAEIAYRF